MITKTNTSLNSASLGSGQTNISPPANLTNTQQSNEISQLACGIDPVDQGQCGELRSRSTEQDLSMRECPICLMSLGSQIVELPCHHIFGARCLNQWIGIRMIEANKQLNQSQTRNFDIDCPMCHGAIPRVYDPVIQSVTTIQQFLKKKLPQYTAIIEPHLRAGSLNQKTRQSIGDAINTYIIYPLRQTATATVETVRASNYHDETRKQALDDCLVALGNLEIKEINKNGLIVALNDIQSTAARSIERIDELLPYFYLGDESPVANESSALLPSLRNSIMY